MSDCKCASVDLVFTVRLQLVVVVLMFTVRQQLVVVVVVVVVVFTVQVVVSLKAAAASLYMVSLSSVTQPDKSFSGR